MTVVTIQEQIYQPAEVFQRLGSPAGITECICDHERARLLLVLGAVL